jgi:hypothetical protein
LLSETHTQSITYGQSSAFADTLIIEISNREFYFCEVESEKNCPLFLCSFPLDNTVNKSISEQLLIATNHFGFSKKKYKTVLVNEMSSQFTLCPTALYETDNARVLLEFNCGDTEQQLILTDDIHSTIKLIYTIDEALKSTLDKLFSQHQLKHHITVLSRLMLNTEELSKENMLISIRDNSIEVIVKHNQQLILSNQYSIKTNEDVLYYVLFILEQYQLNPLIVALTVVGNMEANSELIVSLKKYIKHIRLATGHKTLNWQYLTGMPQHFNYTLLNRLFCE